MIGFKQRAVVLTAVLVSFSVAAPAPAATDATAAMAVLNNAVAAFNRGDAGGWTATCAPGAVVIDDFPPHAWSGASACSDWWSAFEAFSKTNHMTAGVVTLGKPSRVAVTGSKAYIVCPASFTFRQNGKPAHQSGIFTIAMSKTSGHWLMTGWAWTDR